MPLRAQVVLHARREKSRSRFVKTDARPLFNQHADLAQFMFTKTVRRSLPFAHYRPALALTFARAEIHCLPQSAGWDGPLGIFQDIARLRIGAELRQRFVQLVGKFYEL